MFSSKKSKKFSKWMIGSASVLAIAGATNGFCDDSQSRLLDTLIKKHILTDQEAQDILAESQGGATNAPVAAPARWKISDSIKSIGLFGDLRFRYEYRGVDNAPGASDSTYYRERFRYAVRLGIRGDIRDNFNYGIRLETSTNPRSPWATFGSNGTAGNVTPSDKSGSGFNLGQFYLGWKPTDWYEMTVGRMPMQLFTTPLVWDSDINPEGAFEKFKYSIKNVDLFAGFGQFDYQDPTEATALPSSDTFILAWQLGAAVKINSQASFKIAPTLYNYTGVGSSGQLNKTFIGQGAAGVNSNTVAFNQNGINDLLIVEVPVEFNLKIGKVHARAFGDFAYNIYGHDRARNAYSANTAAFPGMTSAATGNNIAYQVGIGFGSEGPVYGPTQGLVYGSTSKKNTWEARVYWQHIEQYALDPNLIDSDFFEGRANLEGVFAAVSYSFTDSIIGTIRYGHADQIADSLGTGGNNLDIPGLNPIRNYNLVHMDLTWRF